jgi:hypothetical protein
MNNINFSDSEIKHIEKYIKRLEKDRRQWPWLRWIMLIGSISIIMSTIYIYISLENLLEISSSVFDLRRSNFDPEEIKLFVDGRLMNLQLEFIVLFKIFLYEIVGCGMLVYCLKNWNRHIRAGILIKALHKLANEE